jgi:hypothetical protein
MLHWAIHVCFKCMFQIFHMFQTYVVSVSFCCCKSRSGCCIYMQVFSGVFICTLQVFHLDFCNSYTCVFKFFLVFCKYFRRMLQAFQLFRTYVAIISSGCCKIDQVLHMLQCAWEVKGAQAVPARSLATWASSGWHGPRLGTRNAGLDGGVLARAWEMECSAGVRPDARLPTLPNFKITCMLVIDICWVTGPASDIRGKVMSILYDFEWMKMMSVYMKKVNLEPPM